MRPGCGGSTRVENKRYIIILSNTPQPMPTLTQALESGCQCRLEVCRSISLALERLSGTTPDLVVVDETVDGQAGLAAARQLVMANPMANLAVVSDLAAEAFHEAGEGLGIMAQLSPQGSAEDADRLLGLLANMPTANL